MVQSQRVIAVVAVMLFAAVGCSKGTKSAADGKAESSAASTGSESGEAQAKGESQANAETQAKTETSSDSPAGSASGSAGSSQPGVKGSTLTEPADGATVYLRVGQILTVVLGASPSSGLKWAMAEPTETVMVPEGKPVYAATRGKVAPEAPTGTETWRFRAAKPGQQTVRLEYRREWQQSVPDRTFRFTAKVR